MSGERPNEQNGSPRDDIDALLKAGGGQETPGELPGTPAAPVGGPADEAAGADNHAAGFTQAEIDAALSGADTAAPAPGAAAGGSSQADIDQAMAEATSAAGAEPLPTSGSARLDSAGRPFDEAAALMEAAIAEERAALGTTPPEPVAPPPAGAIPLELPDFAWQPAEPSEKGIELLSDVDLDVKIELGRASMLVEDVLKLGEGSVIELDKLAGDPVDVLVNERLVARGEVLVLNDSFCVRISEIVPGIGSAGEAETS